MLSQSWCRLLGSLLPLFLYFIEGTALKIKEQKEISKIGYIGKEVRLACDYDPHQDANVTWQKMHKVDNVYQKVDFNSSSFNNRIYMSESTLVIHVVEKNDSGIYICAVSIGSKRELSCGTYLKVRNAPPMNNLLNLSESVKNDIMTAEGILLLVLVVVPGTVLLCKKKSKLQQSLQIQYQKDDGENIYEGLNLDERSMYEDISRGLQGTYQDVGTFHISEIQLEKP